MHTNGAAIGCILYALLVLALPLGAQQVRARVQLEDVGTPVAGALVSLVDDSQRTRDEGVTRANGERTLRTSSSGRYTVRVRRIGFEPVTSEPFQLAAGATVEMTIKVTTRRVLLPPVSVAATRKACTRAGSNALESSLIWDQIRTALTLTELSKADTAIRVAVETFELYLDRVGRPEDATSRHLGAAGARPFTSADPSLLSDSGYVRRDSNAVVYYAPDARVLLSAEFERDHCFWLTTGTGSTAGLIGLSFEPIAGRKKPEVSGTLWIAPTTLELKVLEYRYVHVALPAPARGMGGRIEFAPLPSGDWLVTRWSIRMPRFRESLITPGTIVHAGYLEVGGRASQSRSVDAASLLRSARRNIGDSVSRAAGRIEGAVFDSLLGRPLTGATVTLVRSDLRTTTDSAGTFLLRDVPAGFRRVAASHPVLDSLGLGVLAAEVEVDSGTTSRITLAIPSLRTLKRGRCADSTMLVLAGIRDADALTPVAGGTLRVSWVELVPSADGKVRISRPEVEATADSTGSVLICLPARSDAVATAQFGNRTSGTVDVLPNERRVTVIDVAIGSDTATVRTTEASGSAVLDGIVYDERGRPLGDAVIRFDDLTAEARSDAAGRFRISRLPSGSYTFEVRRLGYARVRQAVILRRGRMERIEVILRSATQLAPVTVRAERTRAIMRREFEERRRMGGGFAIAGDDIDPRRATDIRVLLQSLPSLTIEYQRPDESDSEYPPGAMKLLLPSARGLCVADVYVDNVIHNADYLRTLSVENIAAIELYPRSSVAPQKYVRLRGGCGVLLVWTKGLGW